jgi:hypothetical protein
MINQNLLLAGDDGYNLTKSLRFRGSASAYLNRTPSSAGSQTTWTWSGWVKLGALSSYKGLFERFVGATEFHSLAFTNSNAIRFYSYINPTDYGFDTTAVYRDPSAWYHVVAVFDTTNATAADRMRLYVNGVRITAFTDYGSPPQNYVGGWNSNNLQTIGRYQDQSAFIDGYLTEINFIDGQALTPSSFGETDSLTGVWKPKKYAGTYGTNGFYLKFTDTTSTSTLGNDFSGNSNTWTTNNLSLTTGSTYDSMTDVPTLTSATTANYAVWNPLWRLGGSGYITPTNGNLRASIAATNNIIASTIPLPTTGKWYMEFTLTTAQYPLYGLCNTLATGGGSANNLFGSYYNGFNNYMANGSAGTSDGNDAVSSGDVGLIAVDVDNNKLWIGRNRSGTVVWMGGGNPVTNTSPSFSASGGGGVYATTFNAQTFNNPFVASGAGSDVWDANFGQQPFIGTPPTGFLALNTFNLPEPSIKAGNKHFDVVTRNGFGSSGGTISSLQFQPDFFWEKQRNGVSNHYLIDAVRGVSKYLSSDATAAEGTLTTYVTSFNSNGYTMGSSDFGTTQTMVDWAWKAGNSSGSSNTAGSITSTVSANPTAGFSIVTYTGTGSNATVGHGLGVAPKMIIVKIRNSSVYSWAVGNTSIGWANYLLLNTTDATASSSTVWQSTAPTSSVFSIGTSSAVNLSSGTFVAYCWAPIAGYSAFGSYTGNGSTDGAFIYTGFRPKFIIQKASSTTGQWMIFDTVRNTYNVLTNAELLANSSATEGAGGWGIDMDILSNGFKFRGFDNSNFNFTGITYIYMAFAENPFKNALAR